MNHWKVCVAICVVFCTRGAAPQTCNICGGDNVLGESRTTIQIADQANILRNVSCSRAQYLVENANNFPRTSTYCDYVVEIATKSCNCTSPGGATPSPSTATATTNPPSIATATTSSPTTATTTTNSPVATAGSTNAPTITVATTGAPADGGNPTPTSMPSTIVVFSNPPSSASAPTNGSPSISSPTATTASDSCAGTTKCHAFESIKSINETLSGIIGTGHICLCPMTYSNGAENCPDFINEPALIIGDGQDIVIECVSSDSSTDHCVFACPSVLFHVVSGGSLTLLGNTAMQMTGGVAYSRMIVENGAQAIVNNVTCMSTATASTTAVTRNRELIKENADGSGGCIKNYGTLMVNNSTFNNCTALFDGGALWMNYTSNSTIYNSTFYNNAAGAEGGAIFSNGPLYIKDNDFQLNNANEGDGTIGGTGTQSGCNNQGISTVSCSVNTRSSARVPANILYLIAFLFPVSLLLI